MKIFAFLNWVHEEIKKLHEKLGPKMATGRAIEVGDSGDKSECTGCEYEESVYFDDGVFRDI